MSLKSELDEYKEISKSILERFSNFESKDLFWFVPIVFMLIGLFPVPYSYFICLKIVVCFSCVYYALKLWNDKKNFDNRVLIRWAFVTFAFIYNPILQVHLYSKFPWIFINIITILFLIIVADKKFFE
tara:strand:+ start:84 stop:467 length:384 start_codon:yes stop_codon:yes gene_type:complete